MSVRTRDRWPDDFTQNGVINESRPSRVVTANWTASDGTIPDLVFDGSYVLQRDVRSLNGPVPRRTLSDWDKRSN